MTATTFYQMLNNLQYNIGLYTERANSAASVSCDREQRMWLACADYYRRQYIKVLSP